MINLFSLSQSSTHLPDSPPRAHHPRSIALGLYVSTIIWGSLISSASLFAQAPNAIPKSDHTAKAPAPEMTSSSMDRALRLLAETPLIDGHNDLPWQLRKRAKNQLSALPLTQETQRLEPPMHTDLLRLKEGHVGGQFWSVYVPASLSPSEAVQATLEQIDVVKRLVKRFPDTFELATSSADVLRIHKQGKIASLIGMEGGYSIGHSLAVLRQMYDLGARYMTITHSKVTPWADSATDAPKHDGLTDFGERVIREMNRLGMIIDLSHVSKATMIDTLRISRAPVLFSHSGAGGVCAHPRNVPDSVLDQVKANGGVIMVIFLPAYLRCELAEWWASFKGERERLRTLYPHLPEAVSEGIKSWKVAHPEPKVALEDVLQHIDHIRSRIGAEHIGLGGDFDGMGSAPEGLEDVSKYPNLVAALFDRGYSEMEIRGIVGLNALRVMSGVEATAKKLSAIPPEETPALHWVE
jgi:membrane dipeptidase